jgi:diphosphomevalonate decarboxylase
VKKSDVIRSIFFSKKIWQAARQEGNAFAPTNIALCKYWGKRNAELNLPMTGSLSIALPSKGATTKLALAEGHQDVVTLNGAALAADSKFVKRVSAFFDLFRQQGDARLRVDIQMNIPVAAGLASSACGFASLVLALNHFFDWNLSERDLSILARLGSGSASRSLWNGFVECHAGSQSDGMDSYAEPLAYSWKKLRVGILALSANEKTISSREAMQRTVESSQLYATWPQKVSTDMAALKKALSDEDFLLLGSTSESNALAMHATMLSSWPPICYSLPETLSAMQRIWEARQQGLALYFTQDAGPNLKLLFLEQDEERVREVFPKVEVVTLF